MSPQVTGSEVIQHILQKPSNHYYIVIWSLPNKVYSKMSAIAMFTLLSLPFLMTLKAAPTQDTSTPHIADLHPTSTSQKDTEPKPHPETTPQPTNPPEEPLVSDEEVLDMAARVKQLGAVLALKALVMFVPLAWG